MNLELHSTCKTYEAVIYMAGDIEQAKQVCREYCIKGACVSVSPVDYIYTLGEETGFSVKIINYPRFPKHQKEIFAEAQLLAETLIEKLHQGSCSIVTTKDTYFFSRRESDYSE